MGLSRAQKALLLRYSLQNITKQNITKTRKIHGHFRTGGPDCRKAQKDLRRAFSLAPESRERVEILQRFFIHVRQLSGCYGCWGGYVGKRAEERVFLAFQKATLEFPEWLAGFRLATSTEDSKGIDFILETRDLGEIYIQIKSSKHEARKVRKSSHARGVIVVVSNLKLSYAQIYSRAITLAEKHRSKIA